MNDDARNREREEWRQHLKKEISEYEKQRYRFDSKIQ
jgi:hypothetical protein